MRMRFIHVIREHSFVRRYPTVKQLIKFGFVGSFVTTIDFVLYFSLTRLFDWWAEHFLIANGAAFLTALTTSFFLNKLWTFRNDQRAYKRQSAKFLISNLIALAGTQSILYGLVTGLGITDIIAKPIAVAIVVFWNFMSYKFWVFPHKH